MRNLILAATTLPLAACAGYSEPVGTAPGGDLAQEGGQCDAAPAQYHVGRDVSEQAGAAILEESGARTLRWGAPNSAWTMDYRQDRVNVRYDEARTITEITCG